MILFWLPLIAGGMAFASLRRDMPSGRELAACEPAIAAQSAWRSASADWGSD